MQEAGRRRRNQPAPPDVRFEALTQPNRDPARPWLLLLDDEVMPMVVVSEPPARIVWSSLWTGRPDALELGHLGIWASGHLGIWINELINGNLRDTLGRQATTPTADRPPHHSRSTLAHQDSADPGRWAGRIKAVRPG